MPLEECEGNVNYYCKKVRRKCLPCLHSCLFLLILFSGFIILSCRLPCYSISSRLPNMWHNPVHCLNKILLMKLIWLNCLTCPLWVQVHCTWTSLNHHKYCTYSVRCTCDGLPTWKTYSSTTMYNHLVWAANSHNRPSIKNKKIHSQIITSGTSRKWTALLEGCPILSTWHESKDAVIEWASGQMHLMKGT